MKRIRNRGKICLNTRQKETTATKVNYVIYYDDANEYLIQKRSKTFKYFGGPYNTG